MCYVINTIKRLQFETAPPTEASKYTISSHVIITAWSQTLVFVVVTSPYLLTSSSFGYLNVAETKHAATSAQVAS